MARFPGIVIYPCAILGFSFMFGNDALERHAYALFGLVALASALFWLVVIPGISILASLPAIRQTAGTRNPRVMTASQDGIRFEGVSINARLTWSAFQKVSVSRNLVSLFITPNCAHLVHRDAFESPQQADAFVSMARAQVAAAKVAPIATFEGVLPHTDDDGAWISPPFAMTFGLFFRLYQRVFYASLLNPVLLLFFAVITATTVWLTAGRIMIGDWRHAGQIALALLPLPGFYAVFPFLIVPIAWIKARKLPTMVGERKVALTTEGVHATSRAYDSRVRWQDLHKVARSFGVIYFHTRKTAAIAVPVTAFADKAEADAFYQAALGYWRAAKGAAAKSPLDAKA